MRVFFVNSDKVEDYISVDEGSLLLIGTGANVNIDLKAELDGDSDILKRLSKYAYRKNLVLLCHVTARIYRRSYESVVVIDRGKILGVSDSTHMSINHSKYNLGSSYRIYNTSLGNVGIVVGIDAMYPEVIRTLSKKNSDYIVQLAGEILPKAQYYTTQAMAIMNGITIISMQGDVRCIADSAGDIIKADNRCCDIDTFRDLTFVERLRPSIYDNVYIENSDN